MNDTTHTHRIADFLIRNRVFIVSLFVLITIGMLYAMTQLKIETGFKKQLPLDHEYMQTFLDYEKEFGGANRVLVALVAREGDMFTDEFFQSFEEISDQVFFIPGVDRASVRSIFTPNVRFVEIVERQRLSELILVGRLRPIGNDLFDQPLEILQRTIRGQLLRQRIRRADNFSFLYRIEAGGGVIMPLPVGGVGLLYDLASHDKSPDQDAREIHQM